MSILTEAFRKLNILDEETFPVSNKGIQEMKDFIEDEGDALKKLEVIDQETESEDNLQDSYEGKVIINCDVCHSDVFEDPSNIEIEDGKTKIEHECPYCHTTNEFTIKGQVVPFEVKDEVKEEDDEDEVKVEVEEKDESLNESKNSPAIATLLVKDKNKLNKATSKQDLIDLIDSYYDKTDDHKYLDYMKNEVQRQSFEKSLQTIYNMMLKPMGLGSLDYKIKKSKMERESLKESITRNSTRLSKQDKLVLDSQWKEFVGTKRPSEVNASDFIEKYYPDIDTNRFGDAWTIYDKLWDYLFDKFQAKDTFGDEDDITNPTDLIVGEKYTLIGNKEVVFEYLGQEKEEDLTVHKFKPITDQAVQLAKENAVDAGDDYDGVIRMYPDAVFYSFFDTGKRPESMNENTQAANVLDKYQEWVDYDMKKYHRISDVTKNKLDKAGLEIVKDDHGDYEVIAKDKKELGESRLNELFGKKNKIDDNKITVLFVNKKGTGEWSADAMSTSSLKLAQRKQQWEEKFDDVNFKTMNGTAAKKYDKYYKDHAKNLDEALDKVQLETENEKITVTSEPKEDMEEVADSVEVDTLEPVSKETEEEILDNNDMEEVDEEGEEETTDEDVAEFEESYFNQLGTSYLRENYNNVKSFETSKVQEYKNGFILEGIINFRSGAKKNTKFVFEAKTISKSGRAKFLGENVDMKTGKDSFTLRANLKDKKLLPESLTYNYKSKDPDTGKSVQIYGKSKIR